MKLKYLLILIISFSLTYLSLSNLYRLTNISSNPEPQLMVVTEPSPSPSPSTPLPPLSQISPDGTHNLTLKEQAGSLQIFINNEPLVATLSGKLADYELPFNTWSPNNKYFFLIMNNEHLVFKRTGLNFGDNRPYLAVQELFAAAHPELTIKEVTGWADPVLLILNTVDGSGNPSSFWLDVTSLRFLRLSTYFE